MTATPRALCAILLALAIGGCADSDRTRTTPIPVTPPPPPPAVVDFIEATATQLQAVQAEPAYANRANAAALNMINAHWLYARARANNARSPDDYGPGTGSGILLGLYDGGLDHTHPQFAGRVDTRSALSYALASDPSDPGGTIPQLSGGDTTIASYPTVTESGTPPSDPYIQRPDGSYRRLPTRPRYAEIGGFIDIAKDADGNQLLGELTSGTTAAGLMAGGNADGANYHQGLAYQATILAHATDLSTLPDGAQLPTAAQDAQLAADMRFFTAASAHIVNVGADFTGSAALTQAQLRSSLPNLISALAQTSTAAADRTIFVQAAGAASLPAHIAELRGHLVAAMAVNTDGTGMASSSNSCGSAADWCLAAPGTIPMDADGHRLGIGLLLPTAGNGMGEELRILSGSNPFGGGASAAAYTSGALALLIDYFNGRLGNTEIVERMFATANKTGIYADRSIYGQGLLDLRAATEPFGNARIVTGQNLNGRAALLAASRIYTSPAFGDAWHRALAGQTLATFDDLDTPFPVAMDSLLRPPQPWSGLPAHLTPQGRPRHLQNRQLHGTLQWTYSGGVHPGYAAAPQLAALGPLGAALLAPWPGLARHGFSASLGGLGNGALRMTAWAGQGQNGVHARPDNRGWMLSVGTDAARLELGRMDESGVLDGSGGGALGLGSGATWFAGGRLNSPLGGGWRAHLSAWAGVTDAAADGIIWHLQSIISSSASAAITRDLHGGTLGLLVHQPLRIEHGRAHLQWIADRDRHRNLHHASASIDLSPSGRERQLTVHYSRATAAGSLALALSSVRDPGHSAGSDLRLGLRWDGRF